MKKYLNILLVLFVLFACKEEKKKSVPKVKKVETVVKPSVKKVVAPLHDFLPTNSRKQNDIALKEIIEANKRGELKTVNLPKGKYLVSGSASFHGVDGIKFVGEEGTEILTNVPKPIFDTREVEHRASNITFEKIRFVSTYKGKMSIIDNPGLIFFGTGQTSNLKFKDCYFSAPYCELNGIKTSNETVKGSDKIRFLKGFEVDGCTFENMGRMGIELWTSYYDVRDPSLFDVRITNTTIDGTGLVNPSHGIGMSIAGVGYGLYTENVVLKNITQVGIETVDINNIVHKNTTFDYGVNGKGRAFGSSDKTPVINMHIIGWKEVGTPPTEQNTNSYFQNCRQLTIEGADLLQGILVGEDIEGQFVEDFKLINSTIKAKDPYGLVKFNGDVRNALIRDCELISESKGNPAFVTNKNGQTDIVMEGGSLKIDNKYIELNQNQSGGTSKVELKGVDVKYLN